MRNQLKVHIESIEGETKKVTQFELEDVTELERIVVIQNIFKVIGVDTPIQDMLDDYIKIGQAYEAVTATKPAPDPIEVPSTQTLDLKSGEDMDESHAFSGNNHTSMALAFAKVKEGGVAKSTPVSDEDDTPSHYKTGVKHTLNGVRYQCRFHCEQCGYRKTYYIKKSDILVHCQDCQKPHKVRPAKSGGVFMKDGMNNYFIAGSFVGEDEKMGVRDI